MDEIRRLRPSSSSFYNFQWIYNLASDWRRNFCRNSWFCRSIHWSHARHTPVLEKLSKQKYPRNESPNGFNVDIWRSIQNWLLFVKRCSSTVHNLWMFTSRSRRRYFESSLVLRKSKWRKEKNSQKNGMVSKNPLICPRILQSRNKTLTSQYFFNLVDIRDW